MKKSELYETSKEFLEVAIILIQVPIQSIIKSLRSESRDILIERTLHHEKLNSLKIDAILDFWQRGNKLMPPSIKKIDEHNIGIDDGNHRMNAAYSLGYEQLPVIVLNKDLEFVYNLLCLEPQNLSIQ